MADLDRLLRADISETAAEAVDPPDFAPIEHRGAQRRRTHTMLKAAAATAAIALVAAGSSLLIRHENTSAPPTSPAPTEPAPVAPVPAEPAPAVPAPAEPSPAAPAPAVPAPAEPAPAVPAPVPDQRPVYGRLFQTPFSERVRLEAEIPTMAVGAISSHADVNSILAAGRADLCVLARAHLWDPYWTRHAAWEQGVELPWPDQYVSTRSFTPRPR